MTTPSTTADGIPPLFVSHSHHDNSFCRPFVAHLRTALGLTTPAQLFYDERALHAGDDWITIIQREVVNRPLFIVILTPHSVEAPYVQQETNLAIRLTTGNPTRRLFGLLAEPCDPARLAPLLLNYQLIDMMKRGYDAAFEDLVAAIRAAAQGRPIPADLGGTYTPPPPTPPTPDPRLLRARELAAEAREALNRGLLADAIAKAESALERFETLGSQVAPAERTDTLLTLADTYGRAGQWERAREAATRGRKEDPDRLDCYLLQSTAETQLSRPDDAQKTLDAARAVVPLNDSAQRLKWLAAQRALLAQQQQWERALATLDQEEQLAPEDTSLISARLDLLSLVRAALTNQQRWEEALAVLGQELALAPTDPARLDASLDLLERAGRFQLALELARQLTNQHDASTAWWLARARLAQQVGGDRADQEVSAALEAAARHR